MRSGWPDSNRRPHGPKPCALTSCATPRKAHLMNPYQFSIEPASCYRQALRDNEQPVGHLYRGSSPARLSVPQIGRWRVTLFGHSYAREMPCIVCICRSGLQEARGYDVGSSERMDEVEDDEMEAGDAGRDAGRAAPGVAPQATRPTEAVAYARVAVVRVLSYYYGVTSNSGPIPVLSPCIGDGALIGTTGANLNSYSYALIPTTLVNPITPCQGAQSAFAQFYGQASSWGLRRIQIDLNVAYTGVGAQQAGNATFSIDPSQLHTTGSISGPQLLALPISPTAGSPSHDLPVLQTPQPSDAPPDPAAATLLDLTGQSGALLDASAITPDQVTATLYPVALPATQAFPQAAQTATSVPTPAATPAATSATTPGATAATTPRATPATPTTAPTVSTQAQLTAAQLSVGAVEIDGNGRLIGMVGADAQGNHILYSVGDIQRAIGSVNGKPGQLMTEWRQGLEAFYATPPGYQAAQSAFSSLASAYPDFAGVQPFLSAAQHGRSDIPSLTNAPGVPTTPQPTSPYNILGLSGMTLAELAGGALLVLALLLTVIIALMRRRRGRALALAQAAPPPDEAMLDLLPPDMPLDAVPD